jgi:hypothetical protein
LTLQDDTYDLLTQQIENILSCNCIRAIVEASHMHLHLPKIILDRIYEANHSRRPAAPSRI